MLVLCGSFGFCSRPFCFIMRAVWQGMHSASLVVDEQRKEPIMKFKFALIATLVLASAAAQADWLKAATDSVKSSVTDSVKQSADGAKEAAYDSAINAALGLTQGKTKSAYVLEKLGEPVTKTQVDAKDVWSYDLSKLQQAYPMLPDLLAQYPQAPKAIDLTFDKDVVSNIKMIKAETK